MRFFFRAAPASLFAEEYSLDDLYRIALARSEMLKVAEENLTISEIGKDKAFSYLMPRLTATGGVTQYSEKKITVRAASSSRKPVHRGESGSTRPSP